jgi:hypothetical protein
MSMDKQCLLKKLGYFILDRQQILFVLREEKDIFCCRNIHSSSTLEDFEPT